MATEVQGYASDAAIAAVKTLIGANPAPTDPDLFKQILCILATSFTGGSSGTAGVVVSDPDTAPASNAAAVSPGAGALSATTRALFIGGAGNVTVTMEGGGSVEFTGLQDGSTLPIKVTHVTAASATGIVALW